jgi:hypothetical protein
MRSIPAIFRWQMRLRIFRWYRALMLLEKDLAFSTSATKSGDLMQRLENIDHAVNKMKVPVSFAEQFYVLRGHISFVRERLTSIKE